MRLFRHLLVGIFLLTSVTVNAFAQNEFLYTNNQVFPEGNTVSAFMIKPSGALVEISGSPFTTGGRGGIGGAFSIKDILVHGNLVFVANSLSSDVSVFSIDSLTGSLSLIPGSPFDSGLVSNSDDGMSLAITSDGKFLMAGNTGNATIAVFSVAPSGTLSQVPGSPFQTPGQPLSMKVSPDNRFLVVAAGTFGGVVLFNIAPNGSLSLAPVPPFFPAGRGIAAALDIRCDGKVFVGEAGDHTVVDVFDLSDQLGLVPIPGSPFVTNTGINSSVVMLSPDENLLFVSNQFSDSITVFRVGISGSLTAVFGSFFNIRTQTPLNMITNNLGTILYVASFPCSIEALKVESDGSFSPLGGFPICVTGADNLHSLAVYPAKTCVPAPSFDLCLEDESNRSILQINTTTGDYQLTNCVGFILQGKGAVTRKGALITLQHNAADRRLLAKVDMNVKKGTASVKVFSAGGTFTITDKNILNSSCRCR
jgi:6-phosphogluconolactonase (cycloisomerase 2 family)